MRQGGHVHRKKPDEHGNIRIRFAEIGAHHKSLSTLDAPYPGAAHPNAAMVMSSDAEKTFELKPGTYVLRSWFFPKSGETTSMGDQAPDRIELVIK